jgi:hypothetical protein
MGRSLSRRGPLVAAIFGEWIGLPNQPSEFAERVVSAIQRRRLIAGLPDKFTRTKRPSVRVIRHPVPTCWRQSLVGAKLC